MNVIVAARARVIYRGEVADLRLGNLTLYFT